MATFREWVDAERGKNRPNKKLTELAGRWGICVPTLYYAYVGARVQPEIAEKISRRTKGVVDVRSLVLAPSRAEIVAAQRAKKKPEAAE